MACLHYSVALKAREISRARVAGNTRAPLGKMSLEGAGIDRETLAVNQRRS